MMNKKNTINIRQIILSYIITIFFVLNNFFILLMHGINIYFSITVIKMLENVELLLTFIKYGFFMALFANLIILIGTYFTTQSHVKKFHTIAGWIYLVYLTFWIISIFANNFLLSSLGLVRGEELYVFINSLSTYFMYNMIISFGTFLLFVKKDELRKKSKNDLFKIIVGLIIYITVIFIQFVSVVYN